MSRPTQTMTRQRKCTYQLKALAHAHSVLPFVVTTEAIGTGLAASFLFVGVRLLAHGTARGLTLNTEP
jgi:hypothetical protein